MINEVYQLKALNYFHKQKGFSVENMAAYCGVSRQQIYNVFNEKTMPNVILAIKIVNYISKFENYDVYVEDVFRFE